MTAPTLHHLAVPGPAAQHGGPRRVAWWEWNQTGTAHPSQLIVCVHGLSRQARDFDVLAGALSRHARVVSVDVAGRGQSDWLADPAAYQIPTYAADLAVLLAHWRSRHAMATGLADPDALRIDWVGTSMGGLIGMVLAAQPAMGLRKLVLNDVGPVIEPVSLQRIGAYLGVERVFASEDEAADALWSISRSFGPHTRAQWVALSRPMLRPVSGGWALHYDPGIAVPFRALLAAGLTDEARQAAHAGEQWLWQLYDAIQAQTLLIRGADSDLLTRATALAMTQRGPQARLVEFAGVGHAPTLVADDQVAAVCDFLLDGACLN